MVFPREFIEKADFEEKISRGQKSMKIIQQAKIIGGLEKLNNRI